MAFSCYGFEQGGQIEKHRESAAGVSRKVYQYNSLYKEESERLKEKREPAKIATGKGRKTGFLRNFHPYIVVTETFNDNLFHTRTGKEQDYITTINAGMMYEPVYSEKEEEIGLRLGLGGRFVRYAYNKQFDAENADLRLSWDKGLFKTVDLNGGLQRHQRAERDITRAGGRRILNYWKNSYGVRLHTREEIEGKAPLFWEAGYQHTGTLYDEEKRFNTNVDVLSLSLYPRISADKRLLFGYNRRMVSFPEREGGDSAIDTFQTGLRGHFSPKLKGSAGIGYGRRDPDEGQETDTITANISLAYQFSRRLSFNLGGNKRITESIDPTEGFRETSSVSLGLNNRLSKRHTFGAGISYTDDTFETDRKDQVYAFRLTTQYQLKEWLKVSGGYSFRKRVSNKEDVEYDNNTVTLTLTTEF